MTHVGLNLTYLVPGETGGTEVYARELIPALLAERPGLQLTTFLSREAHEAGGPWRDLVPSVVVPVRARRRAAWVLGEQLLLPRLVARAGVELLHSLANTAPATGPRPRVVTVHDLIHRRHPETHGGLLSRGLGPLVTMAARRADRVITASHAAEADIVSLLGVPSGRVDVVPHGVGAPVPAAPGALEEVRARFQLEGRPVLLTVSAKRPHKNLDRLLEALALLPPERRPILILPGYPTPHEKELRERASTLGLDPWTRFLGWLPDEELEALYATATGFVFPSLAEGFGLPILEAMRRGIPVACANRGAMAEVAGQAALGFDPASVEEIARALDRILYDAGERRRLIGAGKARAGRYTWAATARGTLESYDRALAGAARPEARG